MPSSLVVKERNHPLYYAKIFKYLSIIKCNISFISFRRNKTVIIKKICIILFSDWNIIYKELFKVVNKNDHR